MMEQLPMPTQALCRPTFQPFVVCFGLPWSGFLVRGPLQRHCVVMWYVLTAVTWFPKWFRGCADLHEITACAAIMNVYYIFPVIIGWSIYLVYLFLSLLHFWLSRHMNPTSVFSFCLHGWPVFLFYLFSSVCVTFQASCLCSSAPCLLSSCCPAAYNSTVSRLAFSFFLLLGTMVSVIMILPGMESQLKKVSFFAKVLSALVEWNC